jgi:hypothetical protein
MLQQQNAGLLQGDVLEIFQPDSEHAKLKPRLLVMVNILIIRDQF